jgi:NAD-dependent deacetylase
VTHAGIDELIALFEEVDSAVGLTGAGISTESGIPDFRSPGGLYDQIDPMDYLSVEALSYRPERFWRYFIEVFAPVVDYDPNAGHQALAQLEAAGHLLGVITQNIDGLHTKAGSENVIEVHGHLQTVHCTRCAVSAPLPEAAAQVKAGGLPVCSECGGAQRPDVILFGDMLPELDNAMELASSVDLVLVVGSSLSVTPANYIAFQSHRRAIINRDPTMADDFCEVVINASAGETLSALVEGLGAG